ncbi:MAG: hypothetical protein HY267_07545 [Deltaproteobacteria bacterium]|nr:hypothetical protein [Deltaproteobacteria bacterium]
MYLVNKSPLAGVVRKIVDFIYRGRRKSRILTHPIVTAPQEQEILQHLQQHGWARLPDNVGLDLRQRIRDECLALQREYHNLNLREKDRHKTIWNYLSDIRYAGKKPDENDPLVGYALLRPILSVVGSYLGEIPWLRYIILTESIYQPGGITHSQKWHLDFDDARMLKLFVYLSDVDSPENGPFRMIGRGATTRVRNSFFRRHLSDEEVFAHVDREDVIDMFGSCLSSFIVDTSRVYHCGSRMTQGHSRLLYTALFTAFPSIYPRASDMFTAGPGSEGLVQQVLAPTSIGRRTVV